MYSLLLILSTGIQHCADFDWANVVGYILTLPFPTITPPPPPPPSVFLQLWCPSLPYTSPPPPPTHIHSFCSSGVPPFLKHSFSTLTNPLHSFLSTKVPLSPPSSPSPFLCSCSCEVLLSPKSPPCAIPPPIEASLLHLDFPSLTPPPFFSVCSLLSPSLPHNYATFNPHLPPPFPPLLSFLWLPIPFLS